MAENSEEICANVPVTISLTPTAVADLSHLSPLERNQLVADHTKGMLDLARKAQELHIEVGVLKATLNSLSDSTQAVAQNGSAITISHVQTSSTGRTEIMMGNTDRAHGGKLTSSQTGQKDWTPYYIFAALIALVLIASAAFGHH